MFVAMNRLKAPSEFGERIEHGFAQSQSNMQAVPGFKSFRLLCAQSQADSEALYIAETTWQDEASYQAWAQSDAFARAHSRGGGASPMKAELELFEVVNSQE